MLKLLLILSIVGLYMQLIVAQNFQEECLDAHNKYREQHGAQELKFDDKLQRIAQQWADYLARTSRFEQRPNRRYGENLYAVLGSSRVTGDQVVKAWYDEIEDYDFKKPGFTRKTAYFTQLVWKSSEKFGCAISKLGKSAYVVAYYDPPGNIAGKFSANVLEKQSE